MGGSFGNTVGIGYLAKAETKIYSKSSGTELDRTTPADFLFVAYEMGNMFSGNMATESISDGRLHVRYWENGKNGEKGENTAWIEPKDVDRLRFDCCGDERCSGIKAQMFKTRTYTDCVTQAADEAIEKRVQAASHQEGTSGGEIEKLKLQLEIEKLKLEQERLKSAVKE